MIQTRNLVLLLSLLTNVANCIEYCQPETASCWPTPDEIQAFKANLEEPNDECLVDFPTFTSLDEPGDLLYNYWFPEMSAFLRPYDFLNLRNFLVDRKAYFVVLARSIEDVSKAVRFARDHSLALSVFGTGHEFQDRNAALAPNGLLIRTICLRTVNIDLDANNHFGHPGGTIRLGSGMTWGTSKFRMRGVHEIAKNHHRIVISGHAGEVGIVGWSMGGGHSPLGPAFGLGVDQMLEVELVGADGSYIIANQDGTSVMSPDAKKVEYIEDNSLFWALRGGGAGPWGVVTAMTIKLHKPKDECETGCYHVTNAIWVSKYQDGGKVAKDLGLAFFDWTTKMSQYWSGYFMILAGNVLDPTDTESYSVLTADFLYTGNADDEDAQSAKTIFENVAPENIVGYDVQHYDTYFDKIRGQTPESIYVKNPSGVWTSVLLNNTVLSEQAESFLDTAIQLSFPRCINDFSAPCNTLYQMHLTLPRNDDGNTGTFIRLS